MKRKIIKNIDSPFKNNNKKNILIRVEEEQASYTSKSNKIIPIFQKIAKDYQNENIIVLGRYTKQIKNLQKVIDNKVKIIKMSFDGKHLLNNTDIFIGFWWNYDSRICFNGSSLQYHTMQFQI